jgi:hypothetical protein
MWKSIGQYVGGKLLTAVILLTVGLVGFWFYRHPEDLAALWHTLKLALTWIGFVAVMPWALFFVPQLILRTESNLGSAAMLVGYLILEAAVAFWLAGWSIGGTLDWVLLILGLLTAAIYNFLVCEFIAARVEDA